MLFFYIPTFNLIYAVAGLLLLAMTIGLFYDYYFNARAFYRKYVEFAAWWLVMATSIGGVATTLLYSEVFGFIPCSLCWLQRIALYPQALLSIVAYKSKDTWHYPLYGIWLSVAGLLTAIYQYIYQALPAELIEEGVMPCLADGTSGCRDTVMEVFGFVTFPLLSGVLFLFLIILYMNMRASARSAQGSEQGD